MIADVLDGAAHPLVGVDHLLVMVAIGVVAATARDRRVALLTPTGFVGGMIAGAIPALLGFDVPAVEVVVAASVAVLGLLILTATHNGHLWLPVLAAAFGAVHGHAHGTELPAGATPVACITGFVVTTAALHLAGYSVGARLRRLPSARLAAGVAIVATGVGLLLVG
jgi:urease accessory protein